MAAGRSVNGSGGEAATWQGEVLGVLLGSKRKGEEKTVAVRRDSDQNTTVGGERIQPGKQPESR